MRKMDGEEYIMKTSFGGDFKILEGKEPTQESKININNLNKKSKKN